MTRHFPYIITSQEIEILSLNRGYYRELISFLLRNVKNFMGGAYISSSVLNVLYLESFMSNIDIPKEMKEFIIIVKQLEKIYTDLKLHI